MLKTDVPTERSSSLTKFFLEALPYVGGTLGVLFVLGAVYELIKTRKKSASAKTGSVLLN